MRRAVTCEDPLESLRLCTTRCHGVRAMMMVWITFSVCIQPECLELDVRTVVLSVVSTGRPVHALAPALARSSSSWRQPQADSDSDRNAWTASLSRTH